MISLIEIQPLNRFFFGGPEAFADDNHFVRSEYFPQNTQVLGALRRYILESNRLLKARKNGLYVRQKKKNNNPNGDVKRALRLVGKAGMRESPFEHSDDLGLIDRISPMFVLQYDSDNNKPPKLIDALFPIPLDCKTLFEGKEGKKCPVALRPYRMEKIAGELLPVDYDVKAPTDARLGGKVFWRGYCDHREVPIDSTWRYDAVYASHSQTGIALEDRRVVKGRFYRKNDFTLKSGFRFGLMLEHDEALKLHEKGCIQIGAESVLFRIRATKLPDTLETHPVIDAWINPSTDGGKKLVAVGESFVSHTHAESIRFAFTPWFKTEKRLLKRNHRYAGKDEGNALAPRGSVFFLKQGSMPDAPGAYRKIGYNFFISPKENPDV